jgi:leucyl aminopeptidase
VLRHQPPGAGASAPPVVLVGKGITFDSGGLSLKRGDAMATMKTDMSGAAAVLATMTALGRVGVSRPVVGLLALAENMPSGTALRPGDVLGIAGGTTVEVVNTDAEGRLVLADALAHAVSTLDPAVLVDLATLTGAASVGLGRRHAALYSTDDTLASELLAAAVRSGEETWRMPLVEDYREALASDVADLSHVAQGKPVGAGSVTAALFLQRFTDGRPWAHLDIAGPARADADAFEVSRGGTGYGVRLLLEWLAPTP